MFDHQTDYLRDRFNNLRDGARARLAQYKAARDRSLQTICKHRSPAEAAEFIKNTGSDSWKNERWVTPHGMGFNTPTFGVPKSTDYGGVFYLDSGALDHLRSIRPDDKTRDYGTGWYADSDGGEIITGRVVQLPTHKGEQRWLAYAFREGDSIVVDADVYTDPEAACNNADRLAERMAEEEREYNDQWQEATDLDNEIELQCIDIKAARSRVNVAANVLRAQRKLGPVSPELIAQSRDLISVQHDRLRSALEALAERRYQRSAIDVET